MVAICAVVIVACLAALYLTVFDLVSGREEYNTPVPFVVGGVLALLLGIWPPSRFLSGWKKHIVRAVVLTACLAPLPFGPEGTLVPSGLGILFPPLLLIFPQGVLLTFVGALCLSLAAGSLWHILVGNTQEGEAEPQN